MSGEHGVEAHAHCTIEADGRIIFDLDLDLDRSRDRDQGPDSVSSSEARPQLLLRLRPKKGQPEKVRHLLDLEPADGGRHRAVLEPLPTLAEGRWDAYLLPGPDAERQRLRPGLRDLRTLVAGHRHDRPSPVAVRIPYATKDGYLAVRAWLRTAHAEAGGIRVAGQSMTVRARLHGASLGEGAAVRLRLRGSAGTARTFQPQVEADGRDFSFTVDYEELLRTAGTDSQVWDVVVQPGEGAPPIRIGRLLDDLADRKQVFVYPAVTLGGATLRPYYTVDNDLSVEVTPAG
jgi:hypothetical protein